MGCPLHDPCTVAFDIKYPWKSKPSVHWPEGYRNTFLTIWHRDPERDGSDDSCGWFKRARHGDPALLAKIMDAFEFDRDRTWRDGERDDDLPIDFDRVPRDPVTYYCGWFTPEGFPVLSVQAVTLNMFRTAAFVYFANDHSKSDRFIRRHLAEILLFAENTTDSLHDKITRKFEMGCGEVQDARIRKDRIEHFASIIYAWILRAEQRWWQHPRWHVHHWRFQLHPIQGLKRRYWDRCCRCGKRGFKGSAIGSWDGDAIWHSDCDAGRVARPVVSDVLATQHEGV